MADLLQIVVLVATFALPSVYVRWFAQFATSVPRDGER